MSGLLELWICGSVYPVLWILNCGALVVDPGLWILDCGAIVVDPGLWSLDYGT